MQVWSFSTWTTSALHAGFDKICVLTVNQQGRQTWVCFFRPSIQHSRWANWHQQPDAKLTETKGGEGARGIIKWIFAEFFFFTLTEFLSGHPSVLACISQYFPPLTPTWYTVGILHQICVFQPKSCTVIV